MRKLRIIAVPAALALVFMGSASAPGTRASEANQSGNSASGRSRAVTEKPGSAALQPVARPAGDFNGDGFADLAVGAPFEDIGGIGDGGAVNVLYGSPTGLVVAGNQYWNQGSPGVGDSVEFSDQFGFAAAAGDFNQDSFDDLAIGVPLEDGPEDSGAVNVIYGSSTGLASTGNQVWTQDSGGIRDARERGDQFGRALIAGDFNQDGADDLAIGVPFENVSGRPSAGAVNVIHGSPTGLTAAGNQFWSQNTPGIVDSSERGDRFGFAMTASDFNGDSFADLAVGIPGEGKPLGAGAVAVIPGSPAGLSPARNRFWRQYSGGIKDSSETGDQFGYSLAGGDFDHDGFADLAVGVPFEDIGTKANAGAVNVIYGSAGGLSSRGNQLWTQDSPRVRNRSEARDELGFAVVSEDFNDDTFGDLAIGIPGEDPPTNAGSVAVIFGRSSGLSSGGNELWSQTSLRDGPGEAADMFGFSLIAGGFGNGPEGDLAIGVPGEDVVTKIDAGAVNVAYGSPGGLQPDRSQYWTQDILAGPAERGDRFGYAVGGLGR
jgi:FG-GAP repeat protein